MVPTLVEKATSVPLGTSAPLVSLTVAETRALPQPAELGATDAAISVPDGVGVKVGTADVAVAEAAVVAVAAVVLVAAGVVGEPVVVGAGV
jgi:hypothetical protein